VAATGKSKGNSKSSKSVFPTDACTLAVLVPGEIEQHDIVV